MSPLSLLDPLVGVAHTVVTAVADALHPLAGASATAAAVVLCTVAVRAVLVPLSLTAYRAGQARAALAPQVTRLRQRHRNDPQRLQREVAEVYRTAGVSPLAGCLPLLLQWPLVAVLYRLFEAGTVGGRPNGLLSGRLFGVPLGAHLHDVIGAGAGIPPGTGAAVFGILGVVLATAAVLSARRMRADAAASGTVPAEGAAGWLLRLVPFTIVVVGAVLPLAAALCTATTALWTLGERAAFRRWVPAAATAPVDGAVSAAAMSPVPTSAVSKSAASKSNAANSNAAKSNAPKAGKEKPAKEKSADATSVGSGTPRAKSASAKADGPGARGRHNPRRHRSRSAARR